MWFIGECIHLIFYSVSRFCPNRKTYILLQYRTSFTLTKAHMETHNAPEFILQNHKIDYGNVLGKAIAGFFLSLFSLFLPTLSICKRLMMWQIVGKIYHTPCLKIRLVTKVKVPNCNTTNNAKNKYIDYFIIPK